MQSLSELIDETPPDRLRDNASPAEKMLRGATEEAPPPTAPPRRLAPSVQDALEAAEHGDARALAAYLEHGGDPAATSRLHHMGWSLLHLAAGCALAGGPGAAQAYRRRPEPDAPGGFQFGNYWTPGGSPGASASMGSGLGDFRFGSQMVLR